METKTPIKTFEGVILGYIIDEGNGNQRATDFYGTILGYYKATFNHTTNFFGIVLAQGNILASLIYNRKQYGGR